MKKIGKEGVSIEVWVDGKLRSKPPSEARARTVYKRGDEEVVFYATGYRKIERDVYGRAVLKVQVRSVPISHFPLSPPGNRSEPVDES